MAEEGYYVYCIIEARGTRNFGPIGVGERGDVVSTVSYADLSAVISRVPMSKYVVSTQAVNVKGNTPP